MSTRDISEGKLLQVARYLDGFPPVGKGQEEEDVEQYWVLLLKELSRLPKLGTRFSYTRSQVRYMHHFTIDTILCRMIAIICCSIQIGRAHV